MVGCLCVYTHTGPSSDCAPPVYAGVLHLMAFIDTRQVVVGCHEHAPTLLADSRFHYFLIRRPGRGAWEMQFEIGNWVSCWVVGEDFRYDFTFIELENERFVVVGEPGFSGVFGGNEQVLGVV